MKSLLKPLIIIFMALLFVNLVWTVGYLETSPLYWFSHLSSIALMPEANSTIPAIDQWAIRGQIGDIMSGHFSALAFLAVALSIIYQSEANEQMRESIDKQKEALKQQDMSIEKQTEANLDQAKSTLQQAKAIELQATSIEQQNEALKIQSETLQSQIRELEEARKESSKQTEEFFINNMNVKLDRYYKLFEEVLSKFYHKHIVIAGISEEFLDLSGGVTHDDVNDITNVLDFIHSEIKAVKDIYPMAYEVFIGEFRLRVLKNNILLLLEEKHYHIAVLRALGEE